MADDWVPLRKRPEWADVEPVPQDDGPHPVVAISYSAQFQEVMDYFRAIVLKDERSSRALDLTAEVILLNSANYTVWHFRRLVLETLGSHFDEDFNFMEKIAENNFKNYQFWHHRRWLSLERAVGSVADELHFTELVLQDDAKNYHAWSHRQWVLQRLGGWEGELDYCTDLLTQDIYNNSAWNQRYFVITRDPSRGGLEAMRESEVKYCLKAIQDAPSNESSWRYLRGLFKDDKEMFVANQDVIDVCLKEITDGENSVHALNLLLDLLGFGFDASSDRYPALVKTLGAWDSPVELAALACTLLCKVDAIRARYWAWRRSLLPLPP